MFTNYQSELIESYQPNNIVNRFSAPMVNTKLNSTDASKPYEEHNAKGEHIGYSWYYGETVNLDFEIEGEVTVEPDAFISTTSGTTPDASLTDSAGKKYYNLKDLRSWCSYIVDNKLVWIEDSEFTYPDSGANLKSMYIPAATYLKNKVITVTLYNFRMEPIHYWNVKSHNSKVVCSIDKELSMKLRKGVYYCSVTVEDESATFTVFNSDDCLLLVK